MSERAGAAGTERGGPAVAGGPPPVAGDLRRAGVVAARNGTAGRSAPPLVVRGLRRSFAAPGGGELDVLRGVDFAAAPGEAVAVVGASGAGKSTLLGLLGALDRPTEGCVELGGADVARMDDERLAAARNASVGFVFQFHHLLREFSALENVMMPALIRGDGASEARRRASMLLGQVGLAERAAHRPAELSGGEQQRVAVARALVNEPLVVLADEPTGNLDARSGQAVRELLFEMRRRSGVALVVATHNLELASKADRTLTLKDGVLEDA